MAKVSLAMLVRDEAAVVERALRSVIPFIDTWVVIDTGSQDQTVEIVKETLKEIPGLLLRDEWEGFAKARTRLLRKVADGTDADYALTLDADMTVEGELPALDKDCYYLPLSERSLTWHLPLLTSTRIRWEYRGVTHSYLAADEPFTSEKIDSLRITHHSVNRPRRAKIENDRDLLLSHLEEHPDDPRSLYYLAQSLKDLGEYEAAAEVYERRTKVAGWDEERFHARYREGQMRHRLGQQERAVWCLLEAWAFRPSRAEPLRSLATIYRSRNVRAAADLFDEVADRLPMPADRLFVEPNAYKENRIDWDQWRRDYDKMSFSEHVAFYERVAKLHPVQRQYDAARVREFLTGRTAQKVVEIGGWDGSLAATMLAEFDWIEWWENYEIAATVPQVCADPRYEKITLNDWMWNIKVGEADVLIASHVLEHMRMHEIEDLLRGWKVGAVYVDTPIGLTSTTWQGYTGSHILEVGSAELVGRICSLGYRPTVVVSDPARLVAFFDAIT